MKKHPDLRLVTKRAESFREAWLAGYSHADASEFAQQETRKERERLIARGEMKR